MKKNILVLSAFLTLSFCVFSQTPAKKTKENPAPVQPQKQDPSKAPVSPPAHPAPAPGSAPQGAGMTPGTPPQPGMPGAPNLPPSGGGFKMPEMVKATNVPKGAIQIRMQDFIWKDAPATLPKGSRIMVMEGDPAQPGIFTIRIQLPPYSKILAHQHAKEERVTVISGMLKLGFGERMDTVANYTQFSPNSFYVNPPNISHYLWTDRMPVVLQITGFGPWEINFVEKEKESKEVKDNKDAKDSKEVKDEKNKDAKKAKEKK